MFEKVPPIWLIIIIYLLLWSILITVALWSFWGFIIGPIIGIIGLISFIGIYTILNRGKE